MPGSRDLSHPDRRLPAYQQLRDQLAAKIAKGEWQADELLPSENVISRESGLSVGTVRKAVQQLVDEGLLERRQGLGTFLRKPAFDQSLFRFFSIQLPDGNATIPTSRYLSRTVLRAPEAIANTLETENAIRIKRLRSNAERTLLTEEIWLPHATFMGFEALSESEIGPLLYPFYLERYKVFVAGAIDDVSFGQADKVTAEDLAIAEGSPIAVIERTAYSVNGQPIEWRIARGPASRFRYRSHIS